MPIAVCQLPIVSVRKSIPVASVFGRKNLIMWAACGMLLAGAAKSEVLDDLTVALRPWTGDSATSSFDVICETPVGPPNNGRQPAFGIAPTAGGPVSGRCNFSRCTCHLPKKLSF